jgi:hypothetical protein
MIEKRFPQIKVLYLYEDNTRYYRCKLFQQYLETSLFRKG